MPMAVIHDFIYTKNLITIEENVKQLRRFKTAIFFTAEYADALEQAFEDEDAPAAFPPLTPS
jgi:hypothetical protein